MSIFSQGIHLKGFPGDQTDLRHTHGRRQQQGQALRQGFPQSLFGSGYLTQLTQNFWDPKNCHKMRKKLPQNEKKLPQNDKKLPQNEKQ